MQKPHKFEVLRQLQQEEITQDIACAILNTTTRTLHQLMTIWGPTVTKVAPLIDKLLEPKNTKGEQTGIKRRISTTLGVTMRQVNRLLESSGLDVPAPISAEKRRNKRENAQKTRKMREKYALDVVFGYSTAKDAADSAGVTERQIYRLANKLCAYEGVLFRDLSMLTPSKRERVARRVEKHLM